MAKKSLDYRIEDIDLTIEYDSKEDMSRRLHSYLIKALRTESGMERVPFAEWLGVPYRTLQEWELGRRVMPEYVLRLIAYKVRMEKQLGNI